MSGDRWQYGADYLGDPATFVSRLRHHTIIPHQVEWQPAPPGENICWMACPYCYGKSATFTTERLPITRAVRIIHDIAERRVPKMIFAGYATDPLYSRDIVPLVTAALTFKLQIGFNTKALTLPDKFVAVLAALAKPTSYMSVSVDAGSNEVYNTVHGIAGGGRLYDRVRGNVERLAIETGIELAATYLVNRFNDHPDELRRFIHDFRSAGCSVLRFSFAQMPREARDLPTVPSPEEVLVFAQHVCQVARTEDSPECRILLIDDEDLFRKSRTLPCVARWVYPTVGYDGWLYPCSQTAAPNFRDIALGSLHEADFWDLYHTYDERDLARVFAIQHGRMFMVNCKCDRKEHLVNAQAGLLQIKETP